jgi:Sec-independent protein translocase protein TatA
MTMLEHQLTIHLASEKTDHYWIFKTLPEAMAVFNEVVEEFKKYEPQDVDQFMTKKRNEIEETKVNSTVQLKIESRGTEPGISEISRHEEKWYEGENFSEIYEFLSDKLGDSRLETYG